MSDDRQSFQDFMAQRQAAAQSYVNGDAKPVDRIAARNSPASFFGPRGGHKQGANEVAATYMQDAAMFEAGGETHLEIFHMSASDGLGYWVGLQHAKARLKGNPNPVPMLLRVTEIFRREGDAWKMIHRHADTLAVPQQKE